MSEIQSKLEAIHGDIRSVSMRVEAIADALETSSENITAQIDKLDTTINRVVVKLVYAVIGAALGSKALEIVYRIAVTHGNP